MCTSASADVHALAGVDLDVPAGSTLGVLGHNGAGKTTLIRVLTTLIRPDAGRVLVDGFDVVADAGRRPPSDRGHRPVRRPRRVPHRTREPRARRPPRRPRRRARARAGELIDRLGLGDIADRRVGELSGGSRRRIDLAASLVSSPSVLFLDEPTTGLDPSARTALWDVVGELTADGTTVVLTTQYLDEADRLADDIVVLDHGQIVARGTPAELKRLVGGKVVTATIDTADLPTASRNDRTKYAPPTRRSHISYSPPTPSRGRVVAESRHGGRRIRRPRHHVADARRRLRPPHPDRNPVMTATTIIRTTAPVADSGDTTTSVRTQLGALVARNLRTTARVPQLLMFSLTMPMAMLVLFSQVFRSVADGPDFPGGRQLHRLHHTRHARRRHRDGWHERRRRRRDRPHQRPP